MVLTYPDKRYIVTIVTASGITVGLLEKDGKFDVEYSEPTDFTLEAKLFFDKVIEYANKLKVKHEPDSQDK